jgi:hypothetical protein
MPTSVPEHVTAAVDVFCRRAEIPRDGYVNLLIYDQKACAH